MAPSLGVGWGGKRMETENGSWSSRLRSVQQVRTGPSGPHGATSCPFRAPGEQGPPPGVGNLQQGPAGGALGVCATRAVRVLVGARLECGCALEPKRSGL